MSVFGELRQRKVLQTAGLYFAVAWGVTEILSYLIERIPVFPAWTETAIAILFVLGFPVTVFLSWMFDVREGGVRRADPASGIGKGVIVLSITGLLVATAGLSYLIWPRVQARQGIVAAGDLGTVAVLPFENLTGDPSLGYLGAGLAEDIRQRLLAQTDLKVIGRVSMAGFAGGAVDLASLRGVLNAGLVLEGSLQNAAGQMQVSIALLDTASGRQLWGNTFTADQNAWGPLRQRIVTSLAEQLALTVRVRKTEVPLPNDALEAYLHGLAELNQPDVADGWFDQAVRLAPDFANAWARKALLRVDMVWLDMPRDEAWKEAKPFLAKARAAKPDNLLADIAEASLLWVARLAPLESYKVLRQAEARAPNHPMVLGGLSTALVFIPGRKQDAETYARRYLAQEPLSPDAHNRLGLALQFNGKLDEALAENQRALELDPHFSRAWDYRMNWQFYGNRQAEALATATRRIRLEGDSRGETRSCMLYMAGELLPLERAESMLRSEIAAGNRDSAGQGWWCYGAREQLLGRLVGLRRLDDVRALLRDQRTWFYFGSEVNIRLALAEGNGEKELDILRQVAGEQTVDSLMRPSPPPLDYFKLWIPDVLARALLDAGHAEEAQRLAAWAAPMVKAYAGPKGHPGVTAMAVDLLAIVGDIEGALNYAEKVGTEGFYMHGSGFLTPAGTIPELADQPRWQAFVKRCRVRWLEEVGKFDRMVVASEIVMPYPVPKPETHPASQ